jgi:hypothetical protein
LIVIPVARSALIDCTNETERKHSVLVVMQRSSLLGAVALVITAVVALSLFAHMRSQWWSATTSNSGLSTATGALHPLQEIHPTQFAAFQNLQKRSKFEDQTSHKSSLADPNDFEEIDSHLLPFQMVGHHKIRRERTNQTHNKISSPSDYQSLHFSGNRSQNVSEKLPRSPFHTTIVPALLTTCRNHTQCIQPVLQLQKSYDVYYCKHVGHGVRFYYLAKEGLLLHPKIRLVDRPEDADVIIYLPESAPWKKSECAHKDLWHKIVMLDEGDGQHIFEPSLLPQEQTLAMSKPLNEFLLSFKRSYVNRGNGRFLGYMQYAKKSNVFPMTYTIAEAYVRPNFRPFVERDIEVLCTLRGSRFDPSRLRVQQWLEEFAKARGLSNYVIGQINTASRTVVSKQYFEQMYRSQVIVTANPSEWEGDFRYFH